MGFFSSIGGVLGGIVGSVIAPGIGTVIGSGLGGTLGGGAETLINKNNADNKYSDAMGFAQSQYQFQQDYIKNAMQWRAEDAKKAGYHPMAALGFSSPSFSPVSAPQYSGYSDSSFDPMEFGQSLNYASAKAKTQKQQETAFGLSLDGMRLDNQGKQIQNEIAATELLSMQAQLRNSGPAAPKVNQKDVPYSLDAPYGKDLYNLFTIARHGDTLTEVPHPDIADSITESEWKNIIAHIDAEVQADTGTIKPPVYLLTPAEQKAVRAHRYDLVRVPGIGWKLDRNPSRPNPYDNLSNYEKFKRQSTLRYGKGRQSVSGKIFW